MKKLHAAYGDRVHFIDVHVRQAHPGAAAPAYRDLQHKMEDAKRFQREHHIPWPVLVDDLFGTVHQAYGSLPNSSYILDKRGRVAFYNIWTGVPVLSRALADLLSRGGEGVVGGGVHLRPHPLAALTAGWPALARGGRGATRDLMLAVPGLPALMWAGFKVRRLLAPVALRATPLPRWVKLGVGAAAAILLARRLARR